MSSPVHYPESRETQPGDQSPADTQRTNASLTSQAQQSQNPFFLDSNAEQTQHSNAPTGGQGSIPQAHIWGTDINVSNCVSKFELFLNEFKNTKHKKIFENIEETQIGTFDLNCSDIFDFDLSLYKQLISYPQEVIPLFDTVISKKYSEMFPEDDFMKQITVKPLNLKEKVKMRSINPDDIDCLIAFEAMVTRLGGISPELKTGFFRCSRCNFETRVDVDRGRISHPTICGNDACKARNSYSLIHNRCSFTDRQLIRVQETSEDIPEGETPQTVDVFCYGDFIDCATPGDRIEITGVYKAVSLRSSNLRRSIKSVHKGYIDAVHIKKIKLTGITTNEDDEEMISVEDLIEISKKPNIYQILVNSLAPSIWELDDVKKGLLCQLFGGVDKQNKGSDFRSEINVLLCGDPGTSKSQLLQYVHKITERGIYTSGKGSSAVGLTASVSRDPETRERYLESGALVLSDGGICCIDEFDKMSESARSILHEAMEQQTISVAKAGIICTLNARTSILAAANPKESRYDPLKPVTENIMLPPTLLSRFDLIYLILDKPNEKQDKQLARHMVSIYSTETEKPKNEVLSIKTFTNYISYARKNIHPELSDEVCGGIVNAYLKLRNFNRFSSRRVITATPRQLESLIRMSEALAKMRFSKTVLTKDVDEAMRLIRVATQSAATDPKTGLIDMDLISIGQSTIEKRKSHLQKNLLLDILGNDDKPQRLSVVLKSFNENSEDKISKEKLKELLTSIESEGTITCKDWSEEDPLIEPEDV